MSRQLPVRPNLDHLKNQAKDLLQSARPLHPEWQLADAQFALARSYGFSSWPALKAHVDATVEVSPMTGTWVADVAASRRHPAILFRSASLEVRVKGTRVTLTQVLTDPDGHEVGGAMTLDADGVARPADGGGAAHTLVARWLDARTLEVVDRMDGRDVGHGRYAVSADGRRLIVSTGEQELLFNRV